jgi:hypothetical protein
MPDAAWAVSVHPPSLSREKGQPPVLTSSNPLSTLHQRFAYARLSQSCLPESRSGFPQRSPPWLLTTAACGGLRPAPDCRPRRVIPSSLVQLRIAVWTGVTRDTRPITVIHDRTFASPLAWVCFPFRRAFLAASGNNSSPVLFPLCGEEPYA